MQEGLTSLDREALLLDAGCGNGRWSQFYATNGFRVVGVDFALEMLKAAIRRASVRGYSEKFSCLLADLENLSMFKNESFDAAHLYGVIEHLRNPSRVLAELSRVVRPNGVVLLDCPLVYGLSHITLKLLGSHPFYRFYSPESIPRMISKIGCLTIEKKEPTVYIWTSGAANWLLTHLLGKTDASYLDALDNIVHAAYGRPCGVLYLVRKTR